MKFKPGQRVRAAGSNPGSELIYRIVDLPSRCRLASTGQRAYTYTLDDPKGDITLWVRPQTEMEDGSFVPVSAQ